MKLIYLIFPLTLIVSCSTLKPVDYDRGEDSITEFNKNSASCEFETHKRYDPSFWNDDSYSRHNSLFDSCMRSKGYSKKVQVR